LSKIATSSGIFGLTGNETPFEETMPVRIGASFLTNLLMLIFVFRLDISCDRKRAEHDGQMGVNRVSDDIPVLLSVRILTYGMISLLGKADGTHQLPPAQNVQISNVSFDACLAACLLD
jgi:hypothetical protein